MKQNRKKGFSMIELILVVAIMGLLTALSSISLEYIQTGNIKSAAKEVDSTLTKLKIDTMRQDEKPYMYIYQAGDGYYMYCTANAFDPATNKNVGTKIANTSIKITGCDTAGNETVLGASGCIKVAFKKGSGAFSSDTSIETIRIERSNGKGSKYEVKLVLETGKHSVEVVS